MFNNSHYVKRNRLQGVTAAFTKIGQGRAKDITKEEADALATYWHEITHNRNKANWFGQLTSKQRQIMEMINEFVARKTMPEFYEALGVAWGDVPYKGLMASRQSCAYNPSVKCLNKVIFSLRLDGDTFVKTATRGLFKDRYDKQYDTAIQALIDGGFYDLQKKNGMKPTLMDIKKIVNFCRDAKYETDHFRVDNLLQTLGFL